MRGRSRAEDVGDSRQVEHGELSPSWTLWLGVHSGILVRDPWLWSPRELASQLLPVAAYTEFTYVRNYLCPAEGPSVSMLF